MINFNREWKLRAGMVSANLELIRKDYYLDLDNKRAMFCYGMSKMTVKDENFKAKINQLLPLSPNF